MDTLADRLKHAASDESKRLNVPVSPELMKRIKLRAVEEDRNAAVITRELWVSYLEFKGDLEE